MLIKNCINLPIAPDTKIINVIIIIIIIIEHLEKMKPTNTWVSWKVTPLNKWKWKTKFEKSISEGLENYSRQNSPAENLIKGISTWAVPLVRYSGHFLKLTRNELKQMDQKNKKTNDHA